MTSLIRYTFELFLNGAWVDVTTRIRHVQVKIKCGTDDESPKLTPDTATLVFHSNDDWANPDNPLGPYYGALKRNTPIRISCDDAMAAPERFWGEIFSYDPRWNENRSDCTVTIEAAGALRRIISRKMTPPSYFQAWIENRITEPYPLYYYPMNEEGDASGAKPVVGAGDAVLTNTPARATWGKAPMNDWIPNGAQIDTLNTMVFPMDIRGTQFTWEVGGIITHSNNETVTQIEIDCVTHTWIIQVFSRPPNFDATDVNMISPDGSVVQGNVFGTSAKDVGPIWWNFRMVYDGVNAQPRLQMKDIANPSNSIGWFTMTAVPFTNGMMMRQLRISSAANTVTSSSSTSYTGVRDIAVFRCDGGTTDLGQQYAETKGSVSELTYTRFARLTVDAGINAAWSTAGGANPMGRQYLGSLEDQFLEILASGKHSGIVQARDNNNRLYLLGPGIHRGTIDYSDLAGIEPAYDDRVSVNILKVSNTNAENAVIRKDSGTMSVSDIGPYEDTWEANARRISQAVSVAGTRLAVGTWPGPRFKSVTVSARARPALYEMLRTFYPGDFFTLTGMASAGYYDALIMKVLQVQEALSHEDHVFTLVIRPGEIDYRLWTVGTNRVDLADSTVAVASSGGTVDVNVPTGKWTAANQPFDIMISGERMTVTGVATLTSTTQRLTVTRAVNGVAKTVPIGAEVHLYPGYFIKAVS